MMVVCLPKLSEAVGDFAHIYDKGRVTWWAVRMCGPCGTSPPVCMCMRIFKTNWHVIIEHHTGVACYFFQDQEAEWYFQFNLNQQRAFGAVGL
jgi:hypothetical protein